MILYYNDILESHSNTIINDIKYTSYIHPLNRASSPRLVLPQISSPEVDRTIAGTRSAGPQTGRGDQR